VPAGQPVAEARLRLSDRGGEIIRPGMRKQSLGQRVHVDGDEKDDADAEPHPRVDRPQQRGEEQEEELLLSEETARGEDGSMASITSRSTKRPASRAMWPS